MPYPPLPCMLHQPLLALLTVSLRDLWWWLGHLYTISEVYISAGHLHSLWSQWNFNVLRCFLSCSSGSKSSPNLYVATPELTQSKRMFTWTTSGHASSPIDFKPKTTSTTQHTSNQKDKETIFFIGQHSELQWENETLLALIDGLPEPA